MKERPILFSAPMVRAILAGTKTQTRRLVKPPPVYGMVPGRPDLGEGWIFTPRGRTERHNNPASSTGFAECLVRSRLCPYGVAGDRLWVREAFMPAPEGRPGRWSIAYAADGMHCDFTAPSAYNPMLYNYERWSPSIHMPRWASRITLEVTGVRVERLQAISEEDAKAEGVEPFEHIMADQRVPGPGFDGARLGDQPHRLPYAHLWDEINGEGSWDLNPWVWAISFKRVTP